MNTRNGMTRRVVCLSLILLVLAGCIISEVDEIRLTIDKDGKTGMLELTRRNVQSDESSAEKQNQDFEELLSNWRSDSYLLDKVAEGYYVKGRSLNLEQGVLVWKQKLLFKDIKNILDSDISNDSLRFRLEHSDVIVSTNGVLHRYADSTVVTWPILPGTFILKVRRSEFTPTSDFVKLFKEFQAESKRPAKNVKK